MKAFMSTGMKRFGSAHWIRPEEEAKRILAETEPFIVAACPQECPIYHLHTSKAIPQTWHEKIYRGECNTSAFWALEESLSRFLELD